MYFDTVCQSSIDDFSIFGADGKTQKISDGTNDGIVTNRKKREMGKTTVSSKKLKMGDGKNDGKRKKQENWRWEKGWKDKKSRKKEMEQTMVNVSKSKKCRMEKRMVNEILRRLVVLVKNNASRKRNEQSEVLMQQEAPNNINN